MNVSKLFLQLNLRGIFSFCYVDYFRSFLSENRMSVLKEKKKERNILRAEIVEIRVPGSTVPQ